MKSRMMMVWALAASLAAWPLQAAVNIEQRHDVGQTDLLQRNAAAVMLEKAAWQEKVELADGRSIDRKIADRLEKSRRTREAKKMRREQQKREQQAQQAQKARQASEPK